MPLWQIYHPSNAFSSAAERQQLSAAITSIYVAVGLPPFYVVVVFREQPADTVFVGGEARPSGNEGDEAKTFIRIVVKNIARRLPDGVNDRKTKFLQRVDAALHPFIAAKGWDWEYHVEETEVSQFAFHLYATHERERQPCS